MIKSLILVLQKKNIIKKSFKPYTSFKGLINSIELTTERRDTEHLKKHVVFRPIENLDTSMSSCIKSPKGSRVPEIGSPQSKNNITFSYSNKDIENKAKKLKSHEGNKRCNIEIDPDNIDQISQFVVRPVPN